MLRILCLGVACAVCVAAQSSSPDALASLEQEAATATSQWENLAKDLDAKLARLLPCDARVAAEITQVSRASDARLAAIAAYLQAAIKQATADTASARALVTAEEARFAEANAERTDAQLERSAAEAAANALAASLKLRPALNDANDALQQVIALMRERSSLAEQQVGNRTMVLENLRRALTALQARQSALGEEAAEYETERARWNGYYAARIARAQTECSVASATPEPTKRRTGKQ